MTRPLTSKYGTPLTFNMAIMFLFYVLSVTICLSSVSTCVCVVFNPMGTFRAIANYLAYALALVALLTLSSVAILSVGFDDYTSRESRGVVEGGNEDLVGRGPGEMSARREVADATPIQEVRYHKGQDSRSNKCLLVYREDGD